MDLDSILFVIVLVGGMTIVVGGGTYWGFMLLKKGLDSSSIKYYKKFACRNSPTMRFVLAMSANVNGFNANHNKELEGSVYELGGGVGKSKASFLLSSSWRIKSKEDLLE